MVWSKRFLADLECALIERFSLSVVALLLDKARQIVKANGRHRVFRAKCFLSDCERALIEWLGLGVVAHAP